MRRFKLICKGILLYLTIFAVILWMSGIDSIWDNGYFIQSSCIIAILGYLCYKYISEDDLDILSWSNLMKRLKSKFI